ncbi:MAG: tRNA (adenosine(37)-N6)-dimethylallyltransferase MiaA [Glaciimonas sp.]|nr:tRNA (adenosine(37)-N6)-dimethylallyltransferase MiaA [Glaciimonas sp.]
MNQLVTKSLVIALMGATASGKTAAALEIARHIPSEIISVDSALIYRSMDIGTAKPTFAECAATPHHLIDIIEPTQSYSAMQFRETTLTLIEEIHTRGRLALMVGGTMLYFKALRHGLDTLPQADPALRAKLNAEAVQIGVPGMHAKLALLDPITAKRLKPNDSQRIQRALEIIALSGQKMSSLLNNIPAPEFPFDILPIALEPSDRSILHRRIEQRFDLMLDSKDGGLIAEVESLRARGDLHLGLPSMRCVGYRQTWEYLDGLYNFNDMREKSIAATRQLAKRQLTWLRTMPDRIIIDCIGKKVVQTVLNAVVQAKINR